MFKVTTSIILCFITGIAAASSSYKITKDQQDELVDRIVEIELNERVTEQELRAIANQVYDHNYRNTFIGYRIQGEGKSVYWASTHYLPNLEVKILGSSIDEHQALLKTTALYEGEIIGAWFVHTSQDYKKTFIKKDDGQIVAEILFSDGSKATDDLTVSVVNNQTRYYLKRKTANNIFYTIGEDGLLNFWDDKRGNYYSAPKLD